MICPECKKNIEDESLLFCPFCGTEIKVVPEYNSFEEDELPSMLVHGGEKKTPEIKKTSSKRTLILACLILLGLFFGTFLTVYTYHHSYNYYYSSAEKSFKNKDYKSALNMALKAYNKRADYEATLLLGKSYYKEKDYKKSEKYLKEAISLYPRRTDAYSVLISLYESEGNFDAIKSLRDSATNLNIIELFDNVVMASVIFSKKAGSYDDDFELSLKTYGDYKIYYTLNGDKPDKTNGILYKKDSPINISEGKTIVKAACCDKKGHFGEVKTEKFTVKYTEPDNPFVSPESGVISGETKVTITSPYEVYYTWDGSDPTTSSDIYTGPLDIPTGNNVLSVMCINEHGLKSEIQRYNYIYQPQ
jgi:hypothetical protein